MRFGLSEETVARINGVFVLHPLVEKAVIYGSRAKGTYKNGSDIDLTLFGNFSSTELSKIDTEIDDLMLPYMMDISQFETLQNVNFIEHIKRVGQVFYEADNHVTDC